MTLLKYDLVDDKSHMMCCTSGKHMEEDNEYGEWYKASDIDPLLEKMKVVCEVFTSPYFDAGEVMRAKEIIREIISELGVIND